MELLLSGLAFGLILSTLAVVLLYRALHDVRRQLEAVQQQQADSLKQLEQVNKLEQAQKTQLQDSITQLQTIQAQLTDTQDYLSSIINSMPSILVGVTHEGIIKHWNASATLNTSRLPSDALGKSISELDSVLAVSIEDVQHCIRSGETQRTRKMITLDGQKHYRDITLYPLRASRSNGEQEAMIRIDDVSDQVHIESTLLQNSKLVALGEMSMNLVHELNNPVSAILQSSQLLRRRLAPEPNHINTPTQNPARVQEQTTTPATQPIQYDDLKKLLNHLDQAGIRSHQLIQNLLRFARSEPYEMKPININQLLEVSVGICQLTALNAKLQLEPCVDSLCEAGPEVLGNEAELQQVVVNLVQNALQAIQETSPTNNEHQGLVTLSTVIEQDQVVIRIHDNGPGIAPQHLDKIFTPFFTTKPSGKGTGLGLSICQQIITKHHKGLIEVSSDAEHGTTFSIRLPRHPSKNANPKSVQSTQVDYA